MKPEDIEIRSVKYKTIYNGARGVEVEWTTPEIAPMVKCNLYSLDPRRYKEFCEEDLLFDWCKMVISENETRIKKSMRKEK